MYRNALPQLSGKRMITDGGLETTLVFQDGLDLPLFAAFVAMQTPAGAEAIDRYMRGFAQLAIEAGLGFIMDTPTWRASARWAADLGINREDLFEAHRLAVARLLSLRDKYQTDESPFVLNGVIGPHDDGYAPETLLSVTHYEAYHHQQVRWFAELGADMISAITMTSADEAQGVAMAAMREEMPLAVSFTVETDGHLPSGQPLGDAIRQVDRKTHDAPIYYMINCAHPDHFRATLASGGNWITRIGGVRANASRLSHAELDAADTLDDGDPEELGRLYSELTQLLPNLMVVGGCCGTDHRHVHHMCQAMSHTA